MVMICCVVSSDVGLTYLGTNCDQYLSMVQCCFTSTESARLIRTGSHLDFHTAPELCATSLEKPAGKLQALVYDILPAATVITDYAIGLEKLSANGQFFAGAQMAVSLYQTNQIMSTTTTTTKSERE